jgi:geranylgeranyl diphosphate synthase type II
VPAIERYLDQYTASPAMPENLRGAIRYALLGGGKRLRPVLAWHCCAAVGAPGERSLPAGAAVELVHAFSLVHDDLPAMDDDDLRRGRPTLHIHAGEAMAILAGDAMMSLATELLVARAPSPVLGARLSQELAAATTAMIVGQVYDTLGGFEAGQGERERLEAVHRNKTGALMTAACRMGAMCGLASRGEDARGVEGSPALAAITEYSRAIGLMFQIVDDLLDVEGTPEQTGKRTRKDHDAGKLTYPGVIGVEASRREVERLVGAAISAVSVLGPSAEPLRDLARVLASRRS